jgi:hypothetical protein
MPPAISQFMNKLNANEKMVVYGALLTIVAWIVGIVTGGSSLSFIAGLAVIIIYWLKYAPNQTITWPAPIPTIVLIIGGLSAIFGLLALLGILSWFGVLGFYGGFLLGAVAAVIVNAIGAVMMGWFAWKEYQAMPKMTPPAPPAPPAAPPPPPAS